MLDFLKKRVTNSEEEKHELEGEIIRANSPQFQSIPEDQIQLINTMIEPAANELYTKDISMEEVGINEDGKMVYIQRQSTVQKIMRDLALGNFDAVTSEQVGNYLHLAEECEDMDFKEAADYLTKLAYQTVNITRGMNGFLQKQLGTKSIEFTRRQEKRPQGIIRR